MRRADPAAEFDALLVERGELRRLCHEEFALMSSQMAKARAERLLAIGTRLSILGKRLAKAVPA